MRLRLANHQQRDPVPMAWLRQVAQRAAKRLRIRRAGWMTITFIDGPTMRRLNKQFTGHTHLTDVLSFRYDGEPVIGEILIAPAAARRYAQEHGVPYRDELARYVAHGLLHWIGHEDHTPAQQKQMRSMEDRLLRAGTR